MSAIAKSAGSAINHVVLTVGRGAAAITKDVKSLFGMRKARRSRRSNRRAATRKVYQKYSAPPAALPAPPQFPPPMLPTKGGKMLRARNIKMMEFYKPPKSSKKTSRRKGRKSSKKTSRRKARK